MDAAINPGNSGGPVVKNGKLIGVAFQTNEGQNVGFMVPAPMIRHFFTDIKDGRYDGIPDLLIRFQEMVNPDIRQKFMIIEERTGVIINRIYPDSTAGGILQRDDIILSINGQRIENDGTSEFREGERTSFEYLIQQRFMNDTIRMEVLRDGRIISKDVKLTKTINAGKLIPYEQYDQAPIYYIKGGLLFQPVTMNFLQKWGDNWIDDAPKDLVHQLIHGEPTAKRREIVVLSKVLADDINIGYHDLEALMIDSVNGMEIRTMIDLVKAFEEHQGNYHVIVSESGYRIVLNRKKAEEATLKVIKKYGIKAACSDNFTDMVK